MNKQQALDEDLASSIADGILTDVRGRRGFHEVLKTVHWRRRKSMFECWKFIALAAIQGQRRCASTRSPES